jgi:hypothetical protein
MGMQSLLLLVRSSRPAGRWLALCLALGCHPAPSPGPSTVPVMERDTTPGLMKISGDTSCDRRSGVAFRLDLRTRRKYGKEAVSASFGEGEQHQAVPSTVLWMASIGKMAQLPNHGIFLTDSTGSLPVRVTVVDTSATGPGNHPIGSAAFLLPLKPRWVWWVSSVIAPSRDRKLDEFRIGPPAQSAAMRLPTGDSLYVSVYGAGRRCGLILN